MNSFPCFVKLAALLGCCTLVLACSRQQRPEGLPKLYPLTLMIVQKDTPLERANVTLTPTDPNLARWTAGGTTNSQGVCEIFTLGQYKGLPEGDFIVSVSKIVTEGGPTSDPPKSSVEYLKWKEENKKELLQRKTYSFVPEVYNNTLNSPLKLKMSSQTQQEKFDLGDPVKILQNKKGNGI